MARTWKRTMTPKARDAYKRLKRRGHFKRAGRKGGRETAKRGPEYYRVIGAKGHETMGHIIDEEDVYELPEEDEQSADKRGGN